MNLTNTTYDPDIQESSSQKEFKAFSLLREVGYSIDALTMLFESKHGGEKFSIPRLAKGYKI